VGRARGACRLSRPPARRARRPRVRGEDGQAREAGHGPRAARGGGARAAAPALARFRLASPPSALTHSSHAPQVNDLAVQDYIAVKTGGPSSAAVLVPHTAGRYQKKRFRKAQCPIVER